MHVVCFDGIFVGEGVHQGLLDAEEGTAEVEGESVRVGLCVDAATDAGAGFKEEDGFPGFGEGFGGGEAGVACADYDTVVDGHLRVGLNEVRGKKRRG